MSLAWGYLKAQGHIESFVEAEVEDCRWGGWTLATIFSVILRGLII
jgi:hypothetical protein